jgi:hypothetical protein
LATTADPLRNAPPARCGRAEAGSLTLEHVQLVRDWHDNVLGHYAWKE